MPFYNFKCSSCQIEVEILQSMTAPNPVCDRCVQASCGVHIPEMERLISIPARPQFKGEGFYETDYLKPSKGIPEELKPRLKQDTSGDKSDWKLTQNKDGSGSLMKEKKKKKKGKKIIDG